MSGTSGSVLNRMDYGVCDRVSSDIDIAVNTAVVRVAHEHMFRRLGLAGSAVTDVTSDSVLAAHAFPDGALVAVREVMGAP